MQHKRFQSTLPARGATQPPAEHASGQQFQSTLPARGATASDSSSAGIPTISIHAPRTGSDQSRQPEPAAASNFNPRSPHGERQCRSESKVSSNKYFNPRSPHGERRVATAENGWHAIISIHAPRTGSDHAVAVLVAVSADFNPRSPHGERRVNGKPKKRQEQHFNPRSPHGERRHAGAADHCRRHFNPRSPHGERPSTRLSSVSATADFNPRSPHGERRAGTKSPPCWTLFQSTLPARGATAVGITYKYDTLLFQSTLPARGATAGVGQSSRRACDFNPRSPHGERHHRSGVSVGVVHFNPRSPHGERPTPSIIAPPAEDISIHAPRTGSDAAASRTAPAATDFNPRSPHGERLCVIIIYTMNEQIPKSIQTFL